MGGAGEGAAGPGDGVAGVLIDRGCDALPNPRLC